MPGFAYGGGLEMLNELYGTFGILGIPFGNTTAQMGGWFRKEIKTLDDMKGLKFRVGGVAGQVLSRARRRAAADSTGAISIPRWRRAPSTPPSGSAPTMTRSSVS